MSTQTKKPADHQTKRPAVKRIDGAREVTLHGVTVAVADDALDDFELLDDLRALDVDQNASRLPGLLRKLIGDAYPAVMDALRNDHGRVTIEAGTGFIKDLFEVLNPNS